jgi:hypothetical protein
MTFETIETIEVTVQAPGGLDWSSLLSALLGGAFALLGVLMTQGWNERAQREARLSELVEACRGNAMALNRFVREGDEARATDVAVQLERALISLQAHGARWAKRHGKAHRGFATTIRSLSRLLAERAQRGVSAAYLEALDAVVFACVFWEESPKKFASGDRSDDILQGRWAPPAP